MTAPTAQQLSDALADAVESLGGYVTDADREAFKENKVTFTELADVLDVPCEELLIAFTTALANRTSNGLVAVPVGYSRTRH